MKRWPTNLLVTGLAVLISTSASAQTGGSKEGVAEKAESTQSADDKLRHRLDELGKAMDDVLWLQRAGDIAIVEKAQIYGPPRWKEENPTAPGAGNHVTFYTYLFTPRAGFKDRKLPLVVLPHGGVHSNFSTYYVHIVRELISQGYIIVAPEYRGSTGYGAKLYQSIDYGGREVEDTLAARDWAVNNHPRVDPKRVGLIGWSHGGLITLLSLANYPDKYVCGFAGVPVSDLVQRMGYKTQEYRDLYSVDYFIGKSVAENLEEYKRRSPVWNVKKLKRPLRIHGNLHDEDVNIIEVEHLVQALKAEGKKFEYKVYDSPGGHRFDRLDVPEAWRVRREIYRFLARHLRPPAKVQLGISVEGRAGI